MRITLSKDQYENLVRLVYLGNWMINARKYDKELEKYGIARLKLR